MSKKNNKRLLTKTEKRYLSENNNRVGKMYGTGRVDHLTPWQSRKGKRGKAKPRYKDHK